jgi:hypothetical protein
MACWHIQTAPPRAFRPGAWPILAGGGAQPGRQDGGRRLGAKALLEGPLSGGAGGIAGMLQEAATMETGQVKKPPKRLH